MSVHSCSHQFATGKQEETETACLVPAASLDHQLRRRSLHTTGSTIWLKVCCGAPGRFAPGCGWTPRWRCCTSLLGNLSLSVECSARSQMFPKFFFCAHVCCYAQLCCAGTCRDMFSSVFASRTHLNRCLICFATEVRLMFHMSHPLRQRPGICNTS